MLVPSEVGPHANVACKMRVAETCGAEPLVCVVGTHAVDNAGFERWFAGFLLSTIGPFDCQDELRGPAVGVHLSCHDLAVENNLVWHAFHEQLEVHHPGQCCVGCKRSWHYLSKFQPETGLVREFFSVLLVLDEVHAMRARLGRSFGPRFI